MIFRDYHENDTVNKDAEDFMAGAPFSFRDHTLPFRKATLPSMPAQSPHYIKRAYGGGCNRPNEPFPREKFGLPNEYFSGPFPSAFSNFTQQNFLLPDRKRASPTEKRYEERYKLHNKTDVHITDDTTVYNH